MAIKGDGMRKSASSILFDVENIKISTKIETLIDIFKYFFLFLLLEAFKLPTCTGNQCERS